MNSMLPGYDVKDKLGEGHFATVRRAEHILSRYPVAVKVIDKTKLQPIELDHLHQEVRLMKVIRHPNIVRLYQVVETATNLCLVLELGDGGDLHEYLTKHGALGEPRARTIFRQITEGLDYCHSRLIVHRDLKPENVVFCNNGGRGPEVVKLADFGLGNKFHEGQMLETSCGSMKYAPPEMVLQEPYDGPSADIWSLGVILFRELTGRLPFSETSDYATLTKIIDTAFDIPDTVSPACRHLLTIMIARNPLHRATTKDILSHAWTLGAEQLRSTGDGPLAFTFPDIESPQPQYSGPDHDRAVDMLARAGMPPADVLKALHETPFDFVASSYHIILERLQHQISPGSSVDFSAGSSGTISPLETPPLSADSYGDGSAAAWPHDHHQQQARFALGPPPAASAGGLHQRTGKHTGSLRLRPRPLPSVPPEDKSHDLASLSLSPRMPESGNGSHNCSSSQMLSQSCPTSGFAGAAWSHSQPSPARGAGGTLTLLGLLPDNAVVDAAPMPLTPYPRAQKPYGHAHQPHATVPVPSSVTASALSAAAVPLPHIAVTAMSPAPSPASATGGADIAATRESAPRPFWLAPPSPLFVPQGQAFTSTLHISKSLNNLDDYIIERDTGDDALHEQDEHAMVVDQCHHHGHHGHQQQPGAACDECGGARRGDFIDDCVDDHVDDHVDFSFNEADEEEGEEAESTFAMDQSLDCGGGVEQTVPPLDRRLSPASKPIFSAATLLPSPN